MPVIKKIWGLKNLVFDVIEETTNLVERTHTSVAKKPLRYIEHVPGAAKRATAIIEAEQATAGVVYDTIRSISRGIDRVTDAPLSVAAELGPSEAVRDRLAEATAVGDRPLSFYFDQAEGALNGIFGDYLQERGNHLSVELGLRHRGRPLPLEPDALLAAHPQTRRHVCVFVHGLATTEWSWNLFAQEYYGDRDVNFGNQLERDLEVTSLFVRYNSGRHVSDNGQELSGMLERLVAAYPGGLDEITLIGHSMGGLVVRSAAHYGRESGASWLGKLRRILCIGAPHLGAALEQATNVLTSVLGFFDVPGTQVPAQILNARSDGIKDMRFGYTTDEEWVDRDPDALLENNRQDVPFVDHVAYYFIAGHISPDVRNPRTWLLGDLVVRLPSAAGVSKSSRMPFRFGKTFSKMNHLHLLNHPDVYKLVKQLCDGDFDPDALPATPAQLPPVT